MVKQALTTAGVVWNERIYTLAITLCVFLSQLDEYGLWEIPWEDIPIQSSRIRVAIASRVDSSRDGQDSMSCIRTLPACDVFGQQQSSTHSQNANGQFSIFSKSLPDSWLQVSQHGFDPRCLSYSQVASVAMAERTKGSCEQRSA